MFAKFDADCANEEFKTGYYAGLMMESSANVNKSIEYSRGYYTAMTDMVDLEPENCC